MPEVGQAWIDGLFSKMLRAEADMKELAKSGNAADAQIFVSSAASLFGYIKSIDDLRSGS